MPPQISGKKTQIKVDYVTKGQLLTGEVISNLAANKKVTMAFNDKQVSCLFFNCICRCK